MKDPSRLFLFLAGLFFLATFPACDRGISVPVTPMGLSTFTPVSLGGTDTPTPSPTSPGAPTNTPTHTGTIGVSFTFTPTDTSTPLPTNTFTPTSTFTDTSTPTPTNTVFAPPTPTSTGSATATFTLTGSATFTSTRTPTPTSTGGIPTLTFTNTRTPTSTPTFTNTSTSTGSMTATPTTTFTGTISPTSTPDCFCTMTLTFTPTRTETPTGTETFTNTPGTPTNTYTITVTFTPTFTGTVLVNCSTSTTLNYIGYLASQQQANQPGGILLLGGAASPRLPLGLPAVPVNGMMLYRIAYSPSEVLQQVDDFTFMVDYASHALPNHAFGLVSGACDISTAQAAGTSSYAWNQGGAFPPAATMTKSVVDSLGNTRDIKILFWQVNDLGSAIPPINIRLPRQAAYAWYAFETTGGQQPSNANLLGGTGIIEGNASNTCPYDRGMTGEDYWGDLIHFNTNGSLGSEGGIRVQGGIFAQCKPCLYLPPMGPNGVLKVNLNFGTAGVDGYGSSNGLYSDTLGDCSTNTTLNLTGNLNAAQQANQPGGILQLGNSSNPVLPLAQGVYLDGSKIDFLAYQSGQAIRQFSDLTQPQDAAPGALPNHTYNAVAGGIDLAAAVVSGYTTYAWDMGMPPACTASKAVTDTFGYVRQVTLHFYQVNDLGTAAPPVNAGAPVTQAAWAWYAFDTTGGAPANEYSLIGGTGIVEGELMDTCSPFMGMHYNDRGIPGNMYWGDLLYFNSDGSLASEGAVVMDGGTGYGSQTKPYLYLSPYSFHGTLQIHLNFGSAGMLGFGMRNGITGDAGSSLVN